VVKTINIKCFPPNVGKKKNVEMELYSCQDPKKVSKFNLTAVGK